MKALVAALEALGPAGVLILAILDSAGVPIVGGVDALLIWISITNPAAAYFSAMLATLGSVIGSLTLFLLARKGGEEYLDKYTATPRGARLKAWFREYGLVTVFVPSVSFVPLPLKIFVLSAGALGVRPLLFTLVLAVARGIRYFVLARLALRLGADTLPYFKHHVWQFAALTVGLFVSLYLLITYLDRRRKLADLSASE